MSKANDLQRQYYERTAGSYDSLHLDHPGAHDEALKQIAAQADVHGIRTMLDVGAGTGRTILWFREQHPSTQIVGIEPVEALLEQAVGKGIGTNQLVCGSGDRLPFRDSAFDAVCATATIHHAAEPARLLTEMMRVSRYAIFISDNNRFGHGSRAARVGKFLLWKSRLWKTAYWARTFGRGYRVSSGDGIFYSYSVYDSLDALSVWADRVAFIPTEAATLRSSLHPLLTTFHVLICATKQNRAS